MAQQSDSFRLNSTEKAFSEIIGRFVSPGQKVLAAFSGGCDSLCLLALCAKTLGKENTVAVYVNHNIRPSGELEREMKLNRENCGKLGVNLIVRTLDPGKVDALASQRRGGTEDAARVLRYGVLEEERAKTGSCLILTAHHMQDQIETVAMRLAKGSPSSSFSGIPESDERRHIARPLLSFSRRQLEEYLVSEGLSWSTDSTNTDARFERNRMRNEVIPAVQAIWPDCDRVLLSLSREAARRQEKASENRTVSDSVSIESFRGKDVYARSAVLFGMWDALLASREMPMSLCDRVLRAVEDALQTGRDFTVGSSGALFILYHGTLCLTDPSQDELFAEFSASLEPGETVIQLPGNLIFECRKDRHEGDPEEERLIRFDPALLEGQPLIRFARQGDSIRLKGGRKSVSRLLQDMGIPARLRCRVPVLEDAGGLCAVFASAFGGKDRICVKFRTSLARNAFPLYIVHKG